MELQDAAVAIIAIIGFVVYLISMYMTKGE
jgi:preprotein translocase subunit Sss1